MTNRLFFGVWIVCAMIYGCTAGNDDSSRALRRPAMTSSGPSMSIAIENENNLFYGDTIAIAISTSAEDEVITEVVVQNVNHNDVIARAGGDVIALSTLVSGGGDLRLKIEAQFESGKKSTRYKNIKVRAREDAQNWDLEVVARYPHSEDAYTQGFLVHNGFLYEGTGTYGGSRIMKSDLKTGQVLNEKSLSAAYFGEGITIFNDKLYQLTYKSGKAFVYDVETFENIDEFTYHFQTSEGWGLTHNDTALIASDGSASLYFLNPEDFTIEKTIQVFDENGSVLYVNELEYIDGIIYANIYTSARIIAIDAQTGQVLHNYVARGLVLQSEATPNMDVLNGIAINPLNGNLLITGKNWTRIYEVRPIPAGGT